MRAKETISTQSACPLFYIPRETRDVIYEQALLSTERIDVDDYFTRPSHSLTALLETCRIICEEASSIFIGLNTFVSFVRIPPLNAYREEPTSPNFYTAETRTPDRLVLSIVKDDGLKATP